MGPHPQTGTWFSMYSATSIFDHKHLNTVIIRFRNYGFVFILYECVICYLIRMAARGIIFAHETFLLFISSSLNCFYSESYSASFLGVLQRDISVNNPALVQAMAWHRTGDKLLPESMMTQFNDAYMCHRPQWVKEVSSRGRGIQTTFTNTKIRAWTSNYIHVKGGI